MSTYRLTPNGNPTAVGALDVPAPGVVLVGTSPQFGGQSDGSDASYIRTTGTYSKVICQMALSTTAVPSTERVVAASVGGRAQWGVHRLWLGKFSTGQSYSPSPVADGFVYGWASFVSGAVGVSLAQADVDGLSVKWESQRLAGNSVLPSLSESWVDLVTASVPLAPSMLAPSPAVDVSRPVVSWQHVDRTEVVVASRASSGFVRTLTTSAAHGFVAGQSVSVDIGDAAYDGVWSLASASGSTLTFTAGTSRTDTVAAASGSAWSGDDRAQSRADVRVFSAAQYGAAGFDPQSSASVWSGTVVDASGSVQVTTDLVNGGVYRAYVRTSTTAYGATLTGAWAFQQFTVALTVPPAPGVFTASLAADGHVDVVFAGTLVTPDGSWDDGSQALVERSTDGGDTWSRVWVRPGTADAWQVSGTAPTVDGATGVVLTLAGLNLRDYEAPRGGVVLYRGRQAWTGESGVLLSAPATAPVDVPRGDWRLVGVDDPAATLAVPMVTVEGYGEQTDSQTESYQPPGGGTFVIRRPWAGTQTSMQALVDGPVELAALRAVLASGRLLVQSQIPADASGWSSQSYAVVTGTVSVDPVAASLWRVSWSLVEIGDVGVSVV